MNLHEYQAKQVIQEQGVAIQEGIACSSVDEATKAYQALSKKYNTPFVVIKAQIHAGGRGKGTIQGKEQRGVAVAKDETKAKEIAANLLGGTLVTIQTGQAGKRVNKILVAQDVYYEGVSKPKEFYISILVDRYAQKNVIIYSTEGGMDIEEVSEHAPEKIHKIWVDPALGIQGNQCRKICFDLGLSGNALKEGTKFVANLYKAFVKNDCSMIEINPMLKTADDKIIAVDCKMQLDDNALFRHPHLEALRDKEEEDATEVEASEHHLNYVKLDGNVGCMVNGAGLAMATMDMIKLSGGEPANFLDVGGGANATTVEAGFRIILKDPKVKAILINIFGGIVRCDRVANGVIEAYNKIGKINIPIIVRLQGTKAEEAQQLIAKSGLNVQSAILLSEAAALVSKSVK